MKHNEKTTMVSERASVRCRLAVAAMLLVCASCEKRPPQAEPEGVVARIGGRVVTVDDIRAEALRRQAIHRPVLSKEKLLEHLLAEEALLLRAQRERLAEDPGIKQEIDRLLAMRLRGRALTDKLKSVAVSEEEIKKEYQRHINKYIRPALDRIAVLFLRVEKNASDEKKQQIHGRMAAALKQAEQLPEKNGFGSLAISCSDDQLSRYRGGDTGWIARGQSSARLPELALEVGRALAKGSMSDVLETGEGLYLVMKTDFRPCSTTAYEQVRGSLRHSLLADRRRSIEEQYLDECVQSAHPEINEDVLEGLKLDTMAEPAADEPGPILTGGLPVVAK
ncbi:MAG: peptidylprolyl isomerase [Kiritimatiellales bacterium]|nr:peptidylprolyl isomerase [Kiritimatiellales bacterium]